MRTSHIITSYFLQILKKCFSNIGARERFYISSRVGSIFYNYLSTRKKQARENIIKAFPELDSNQIENILKNTYLNFCHNFIELVSFPNSYGNMQIEVKGELILQSFLKQKRGIVFITGHFGAWEILGQWVARNVPLFAGVAQKQKNKGAHDFFINQRELAGTKHIIKGDSIKLMYEVLSNNGVLGLVSDQDAKKKEYLLIFLELLHLLLKGLLYFILIRKHQYYWVSAIKKIFKSIIFTSKQLTLKIKT